MSISARAILMRFRGDVTHACDYCETIAWTYGYLTREYRGYREEILNHRMKRTRKGNHGNVTFVTLTPSPNEPKKEG